MNTLPKQSHAIQCHFLDVRCTFCIAERWCENAVSEAAGIQLHPISDTLRDMLYLDRSLQYSYQTFNRERADHNKTALYRRLQEACEECSEIPPRPHEPVGRRTIAYEYRSFAKSPHG